MNLISPNKYRRNPGVYASTRSNQLICRVIYLTTSPTYTIANRVPIPTTLHIHFPKNKKLAQTARVTSIVSIMIFALGNGSLKTWLTAIEIPSPGIVSEPHLISKAIPIPMTVHPASCINAYIARLSHIRNSVSHMFRSISFPKTNPRTIWNICTKSNLSRRIRNWHTTNKQFIRIV